MEKQVKVMESRDYWQQLMQVASQQTRRDQIVQTQQNRQENKSTLKLSQ